MRNRAIAGHNMQVCWITWRCNHAHECEAGKCNRHPARVPDLEPLTQCWFVVICGIEHDNVEPITFVAQLNTKRLSAQKCYGIDFGQRPLRMPIKMPARGVEGELNVASGLRREIGARDQVLQRPRSQT